MSKEFSGLDPWAEGTQQRQQQKKVRVLMSCPHLRWSWGRQDQRQGCAQRIGSRTRCLSRWGHFGLCLLCPCLESFLLSSSPSCPTFCFVCEMSGRVWHVVITSTHVLHPAHGWCSHAPTPWNSEKEGPHSEAEHKTKHNNHQTWQNPSLVHKGMFVHLKIFFIHHLSIMTERDYSRFLYSPNLWCSFHDSKQNTIYVIPYKW